MPRVTGNLSKKNFVHYWRRRSHFSAGFARIVLNGVHKDFSQAAFSYFSPSHFPKYSSTTSAGWLWNIVTVKEWHFSAGVVQIVLKRIHKDFSQAGFSYFLPLHFPNCSSTTFAGWLWNFVTVKEWHFSAGVVQTVLKQVHKDFSQAGFSYFWPLNFPNYTSTTSAIYFLKHSSFKWQVWNLSNHKKQSEQFWSIFLRLESEQSYKAISRVESEQSYTAIWAIWAMFSRVESGCKTEMMSAWMLLLLRHNHLKVISVEDKKSLESSGC